MPLTVPEDSLATVAEADAYHEARGNISAWMPLETTHKEQLLRQALDYLRGEYAGRWPAVDAFGTMDGGVIAAGARNACALLALAALDGPLDPEVTPQALKTEVGPIKSEFATTDGRRKFPAVAALMRPYLMSYAPSYSIPLVRS